MFIILYRDLLMPVIVEWDNDEQTVIRTEVVGTWTWMDYHDGTRQVFKMMDAVEHDVIGIINTRDPHTSLPDGNPMPHFNNTARKFAERPDLLIVNVNQNLLMRMMSSVFGKLMPGMSDQYRQAATLEDARKILRDHAQQISSRT